MIDTINKEIADRRDEMSKFKLSEEHQLAAKEIVKKHITKRYEL